MNAGVTTPVLLWLLSHEVENHRLANSLKALESFLVRRMVCCLSTRGYGRLFVALIEDLGKSGQDRADESVVEFFARQESPSNRWPNDQEILSQFVEAPLYWWLTRGRLKLVLEGIESELRTSKAETDSVPQGLHIEHILPQSWHENWPLPSHLLPEDRETTTVERNRVIHSIGNLTLVNKPLNSSLSNARWDHKRKSLGDHSVLFLNKSLLDNAPDVWNESAISERARHLHKIAVEVWPHANYFS